MSRITFVKRENEKRTEGGGLCIFSACYPQAEDLSGISSFYAALAENAERAAFSSAESGKRTSLRIIPKVRYEDGDRIDITLDIISSENGELKIYKRIAQCWNIADETLFKPKRKGEQTFFDGRDFILIRNLFGKEKKRRISEYIEEVPEKDVKRRVFRQPREID